MISRCARVRTAGARSNADSRPCDTTQCVRLCAGEKATGQAWLASIGILYIAVEHTGGDPGHELSTTVRADAFAVCSQVAVLDADSIDTGESDRTLVAAVARFVAALRAGITAPELVR